MGDIINHQSDQKIPMEYPADLSFIPEDDLVELVWENGQITMQSQSSRVRDSQNNKPQDKFVGKANTSRNGRFGPLQSFLDDAPSGIPSSEVDLSLVDDMVPWFDDFLPKTSGVTMSELPIHNSLTTLNKRSCVQTFESLGNVSVFNSHKSVHTNGLDSHSARAGPMSSWSITQGRTSVSSFVSGVSDILASTTTSTTDVIQPSPSGSLCLRKIKDLTLPSSSAILPNFPFLSRHAAIVRAGLQHNAGLPSCSPAMETTSNKEKTSAATGSKVVDSVLLPAGSSPKQNDSQNQLSSGFSKVYPRPSGSPPPKLPCSANLTNQLHQEDVGENVSHELPVIGATPNEGILAGEKNVELVIASSSVCSGSSADKASDCQRQTLKRKDRDSEETEYRSEDVEEESVGVRKEAPARGGTGSKRNRAAEVHNLSERRRRERINEKMKALQELIPNCNKVDKASMLDEAIEYLKTLQLQIQMLSMRGGIYMPQMMFPAGMQHMYAAQVSHLAPMGMGYGMRMVDMNGGSPMFPAPPIQRPDFPSPSVSGPFNFSGLGILNLPNLGHPGQGHPLSVPRAPLEPLTGHVSSSVVVSATRKGSQVEVPSTSQTLNSKDHPVQSNDPRPLQDADVSSQRLRGAGNNSGAT